MRILGLELGGGTLFPSRKRSNEARDSFEGLVVGASVASFDLAVTRLNPTLRQPTP